MTENFQNRIGVNFVLGLLLLLGGVSGCQDMLRKAPEREAVARVGERYLYVDDVLKLLPDGVVGQDSIAFVADQINTWATRELLFSKAQFNLPEEKLAEYDALVADYKADLYTRAYKEAMVAQSADTLITDQELQSFYETEKENFKLLEKIVQLRFIALPLQFMNREEVTRRLKRFEESDVKFLDSVGVQFLKLNFNDSLWVPAARVIQEIPPLTAENETEYLQGPNYFELQDDTGTYMVQINNVKMVNEVAPLSFVEPTIRQVLLNRRKMKYLRNLEADLLNEATERKEFEIYE